jgi:hypothetical protein
VRILSAGPCVQVLCWTCSGNVVSGKAPDLPF